MKKLYLCFLVSYNFFNKKSDCFKSVKSSKTYSSKTYGAYYKKNPDIIVKKHKVYTYNNYYRPWYRRWYYSPWYTPYYSNYDYLYRPYYFNCLYTYMPNTYYKSHYSYMQNNYNEYSYLRNLIYIFLMILFILFLLLIIYFIYKITKKIKTYTYEKSYNNKYNEKINFHNGNTINNIINLYVPEILQIRIPNYDNVNYYIFNTRDDNNKIENPNVFMNILNGLEINNSSVKNIEIILSPINIFFLDLENILNKLSDLSTKINIHFAFVKDDYENDFYELELIKKLENICKFIQNDPIKIIGYSYDEENNESFSNTLNNIFNKYLNLSFGLEKLQFVKT